MTPSRRARAWSVALALVPALMLCLGVPFVNRIEPRVAGLPFVMAWIVAWTVATPIFMALVDRLGERA